MILRLDQQDELSCQLYRRFEARVREFAGKYDLHCPIDAVLYEMKQRWFLAPGLACYLIDYDEVTLQVHSHLAGWINSAYGSNRLYVYQAEVDRNRGHTDESWAAVRNWLDDFNRQVADPLKVTTGEFSTWHDAELWARYLRKLGVRSTLVRQTIELDLREPE